MKLRNHQSELNQAIDGIISGSGKFKNIDTILLSVVPGGGKGSVVVNAGKFIKAGLVDSIVCIVPRQSLQLQAESVCMDKFFQDLFSVKISIRASTNESNPSRGRDGFVTSYQALGHDKNETVLEFMKRRRCVLINDEIHHQSVDSPWYNSLKDLVKAARYVIHMSGTLSRADGKKIGFLKYKNGYVDLTGDDHTYVIKYSRSEALREKAILPLSFHLYDSSVEFEEIEGGIKSYDSFRDTIDKDLSKSLYTALETEFAFKLIDETLHHWLEYKRKNKRAKVLFVCARIGDARRCIDYLNKMGVPSLLATSHESNECIQNISSFKANAPVLVSIAVCYEGLDVPPVSHICILTRIRSKEWLEQCCSRATRWDKQAGAYNDQLAYIFAPKDKLFLDFVTSIEFEQKTHAKLNRERMEQLPLFQLSDGGEGGQEQGPCKPIRSQILEMSKKILGNQQVVYEPIVLTPKQEEMDIRKDIDRYLKKYAFDQGFEIMEVNREAKQINQKPRKDMTLKELRYFFNRVQILFPLTSGNFIPLSNCMPVFDYTNTREFELENEKFF